MNQHASRRKLMVIGGNEDKQGECSILREFIRLAGGTRARVLLLTVSAEDSRHMADPYLRLFRRLGVKNARHIDVRGRADTYSSLTISAAESATAILIAADDQLDVNSLLGGTELDKTLRRKSDQGTVLAGTGAGAAMLSHAMISDAVNSSSPLAGTVCRRSPIPGRFDCIR